MSLLQNCGKKINKQPLELKNEIEENYDYSQSESHNYNKGAREVLIKFIMPFTVI